MPKSPNTRFNLPLSHHQKCTSVWQLLPALRRKRKTPADGSHQLGFPRFYTGLVGRDNN